MLDTAVVLKLNANSSVSVPDHVSHTPSKTDVVSGKRLDYDEETNEFKLTSNIGIITVNPKDIASIHIFDDSEVFIEQGIPDSFNVISE